MNESVCIYLRKSRADREAEAHGEGETLARHERILLDLAKKKEYIVGAIYREVVSGETIADRPVMQQLLHEVESGMWDGVLVVEVDVLPEVTQSTKALYQGLSSILTRRLLPLQKYMTQTTNSMKSILSLDYL